MVQKEFFGIDYNIFYHVFCIRDAWFVWFKFLGSDDGLLYSINKEISNFYDALDIAQEAKAHHQSDCLYKMVCSLRDAINEEFPDDEPEEERLNKYLASMTPIIPKKK